MEHLTTSLPTVTPEIIQSFEGLEAVAILGLCFFVLLAVVIPISLCFILRNHTKEMGIMKDAFNYALDKRDADQRKITETLDKMIKSIDTRLSTLEKNADSCTYLHYITPFFNHNVLLQHNLQPYYLSYQTILHSLFYSF